MPWWMNNTMRMIQCNLRETDAQMDVDRLISDVESFSANTLMIGAGGITAFYPTKLPYHYSSPYLKKDVLRELVEKCHEKGIRVIARFDFSKAHVSIFQKHPDWFYRSPAGNSINFNDMVHTCVNGEYQRKISLDIISEVLDHYDVDGIFFNMFGYQTRDYSEKYHGICQCENCKKRFLAFSGHTLPACEPSDLQNIYEDFKKVTVHEMLDSIYALVKSKKRDIAICTYTNYKVDIVRNESNSALSRPYPVWVYSASDNVMTVENSAHNQTVSNCAINAADIFYRFMGVSPYLTKLRLYENIASGSGLDFCIIGVFEDYPETAAFDGVKQIFELHKRNEKYYGHLSSCSEILLVKPCNGNMDEYRGIFKMLKEAHCTFDVIPESHLKDRKRNYKIIILPSVTCDIEQFGDQASIIATHRALTHSKTGLQQLKDRFGAHIEEWESNTRAAYLLADNKTLWKHFSQRDWIILDGELGKTKYDGQRELFYKPPSRYGPPERCGGIEVSQFCGVGIKQDAIHSYIHIPWQIGALYYRHGYEEHKNILLDILSTVQKQPVITVGAPEMVEVFYHNCPGGQLVQLLNLSGFNGTTFFAPLPVFHITIALRDCNNPCEITRLSDGAHIAGTCTEHGLCFRVDCLEEYEAFLIKEKGKQEYEE